ncbi:HAD superfamily hydrolase (TIGR01509 family) [Endobacter medicaginis]|uniref:HAD family phosphatase n=1 Tax=Endobacter medicaginis TaxID=1181271 RepID=A0A850NKP3_9PROT|nr:HAD family phosphatase [Endobacter medicaginis]MBB3172375.1 HAD superfamily hydrolase (TIGR01509 family) [Endobacter medicaginis]MCX5476318.1 HAD family phosphatase [Endobacter medicaginis]NVN29049.1 HAD family phosphatase [Endobacter medicaginis]
MSTIDAVIFDMDGLILDTETLAMDALVSAGAELGYDMPRSFCHLMIGAPADRCRELVVERYGADFPLERYFELQEIHLRRLVDAGRMQLKRGVLELLDWLDAQGIRRAIATSSSRARTDHHLGLMGIAQRFEHIVTRDDVTRGKPNPDPFLTAAKKLGIAPAHCLVLEDSFNGIRAAHAAGMRVIMVPDLLDPTDEIRGLAHRVVPSLHDVIDFLDAQRSARAA